MAIFKEYRMNVTTVNNQTIQAISSKPIDKPMASSANTAANTNEQSVVTGRTEISNEGIVANYLTSLSPQQRGEVEEFVAQIHQQKTSGSFDAKAASKQAPNSINELSSKLNVSTEDLLSHIPAEAVSEPQLGGAGQASSPAIKSYMAVAP
jgi:hypothetical protein